MPYFKDGSEEVIRLQADNRELTETIGSLKLTIKHLRSHIAYLEKTGPHPHPNGDSE